MTDHTPDQWQVAQERFERLFRATVRITAEHDLDRVLQEIVDSACEVTGARYGALGVLGDDKTTLRRFVVSGVTAEEHARIGELPIGKGILGLLISDPRPLRLDHLGQHPKSCGFPAHHPRMETFLGVPIPGKDGSIGNLYLTEKMTGNPFSEADESLVVMLAAHAAVAVENARLWKESATLVRQLKRLHASRDRFFAMINHELRNALTAVHGWAELWLRKERDDAPREAREVRDSAEWSLTLLEDLLDLSRLEASKLHPVVRDANAWDAVHEAIATVEPQVTRYGVRVVTEGAPDPVECRTDPNRIRQILINLLSNAARYSPKDQPVVVRVIATADSIGYHVIDRGPGIAQDQQIVIFQAFERADTQTERGTGLGLALSRQLARLLGGDIEVRSRPGHGAQFTLTLPRFLDLAP